VHFLLSDVEFHEQLWRIDFEEADRRRSGGCPRTGCSGRLNWANFPRKVWGLVGGGRWFEKRFGLCCGRCRRRVLPATVRKLPKAGAVCDNLASTDLNPFLLQNCL
jgi:hypothetical protein